MDTSKVEIEINSEKYCIWPLINNVHRNNYNRYSKEFYNVLKTAMQGFNISLDSNRKNMTVYNRILISTYLFIIGVSDWEIADFVGKDRTTIIHYRKRYNDSKRFNKDLYSFVYFKLLDLLGNINHKFYLTNSFNYNEYVSLQRNHYRCTVSEPEAELISKSISEIYSKLERKIKLEGESKINVKIENKYDLFELSNYIIGNDIKYREHFLAFMVNPALKVLNLYHTIGSESMSVVSIKQLIAGTILSNASGLLIVHNHPSEDITLSDSDINVLNNIFNACKYFDIKLLDFMIINKHEFNSIDIEDYVI